MFINEAKKQILETVKVYLETDELGMPYISRKNQRPIFLIGAPGIGKTDIMEQVAAELGINLVSYSMTHHTRQSALGLPYIVKKNFESKTDGESEVQTTLYTMSEIIETMYEKMDETKIHKGILFLDELNCVSETLAPAMLQFLQYKEFGGCKVPDGWVIVTAGNPPEYNSSVREFDVVTSDRLKRIDVEPSYEVWKDYAVNHGIHPAVTSFLDSHESYFYSITNEAGEKCFATARGWYDLSETVKAYERQQEKPDTPKDSFAVDEKLICQYIQNKKIAKEFSSFYALYAKYKQDYKITAILDGKVPETLITRARNAQFDERYALITILYSAIVGKIERYMTRKAVMKKVLAYMKDYKNTVSADNTSILTFLAKTISSLEESLESPVVSGKDVIKLTRLTIRELEDYVQHFKANPHLATCGSEALVGAREIFNPRSELLTKERNDLAAQLDNVYTFCEKAFEGEDGDIRELLILSKELTVNDNTGRFITEDCGLACKYFKYNKRLIVSEIGNELSKRANDLAPVIDSLDRMDDLFG